MSVLENSNAKLQLRKQTLNHPLVPTEVDLGDGTKATAFPITAADHVPLSLLIHMCDEFNEEIERGQTYPVEEQMNVDEFHKYWMGDFTGILLQGSLQHFKQLAESTGPHVSDSVASSKNDPSQLYYNYHEKGEQEISESARLLPLNADWDKVFLGTFHILPNFPGRSSHICNCGFLVSSATRGSKKKLGTTMGKLYLSWAPELGYTYSMFNLVYVTNKYSVKIWENLGFDKIGRVPGVGILKGFDEPVDSIIFGKKLA